MGALFLQRYILERLTDVYCGSIGYEYMHIPDRDKCNWVRQGEAHVVCWGGALRPVVCPCNSMDRLFVTWDVFRPLGSPSITRIAC